MTFDPSTPFQVDTPDLGSITIEIPDAPGGGLEINRFLSYDYSDEFLEPSDAWNFTLSADQITDEEREAIVPRAKVRVTIDDSVQSTGYIDDVTISTSRSGGSILHVEGRDWLSPAVDAQIDPSTSFNDGMTLEQLLTTALKPFGVSVLSIDNTTNRNAISGGIYGTPTSKKGKPLKSFLLHRDVPYPQEGAFGFTSRVAQRFGLWIWPAADGKTVIVGQPDFDQAPRYQLVHAQEDGRSNNNVLESTVKRSGKDQPSILLARGFGGGDVFAKTQFRNGIINPAIQADTTAIQKSFPNVKFVAFNIDQFDPQHAIKDPFARPMYLKDSMAHTQEQLDAFLRRELSLRMRKAFHATYTILGHRIGGLSVAVDTVVSVSDDVSDVNEPLWVLSRRFQKSNGGGTKTTLDLIRNGSLAF